MTFNAFVSQDNDFLVTHEQNFYIRVRKNKV